MRYFLGIFLSFLTLSSVAQTPELTIQLGHSKLIYDVAYSPDGKYAASASADRTVKIWELEKGREVRTIYIDLGYATTVEFSADSKRLLVGGGSYEIGILKIFDLETGNVIRDFIGHEEYAWQAGFSPNQKWVFSAGFDGTLRKWDVDSGKQLASSPQRSAILRGLAMDPKGEYVATTCDDSDSMHVIVWKASDLSVVRELKLPAMFEGRAISWSAKGSYIFVGDWGGEVAIFNRDDRQPTFVFEAQDDVIADLKSDQREKTLFTASHDNLIHQWEISSGLKKATFFGHKDRVYAIDVHPSKPLLLSGGSFDKSLMEWDIPDQSLIRALQGNVYPVRDLRLSDDGNRLLINSYDDYGGDVYSWRLDRLNQMNNLGYTEERYQFMDVHGDDILLAGSGGNIQLIDAQTADIRESYYLGERISDPRFSPDGSQLLIGFEERKEGGYYTTIGVDAYDPASARRTTFASGLDRLPGRQIVRYGRDGKYFYVFESTWGQVDLRKYDGETKEKLFTITDTTLFAGGFDISPDGRHGILAGSGKVLVYDMNTGRQLFSVSDFPRGSLSYLHFMSDDLVLLSGGDWSDGFVSLLSITEQKILRSKTDFTTPQQAVTYDPARKLIISGGDDARITFMDADSWEVKMTLFAFAESQGAWAAITPSGLFDGSKDAIEQYLYFTYRLEPIELFQLKERYYEPGLIQKVLGYNVEPMRDVSKFDQVSLYPKAGLQLEDATLEIQLMERSGGTGRISFLINGKEMVENIAPWFDAQKSAEGEVLKPKNVAYVDLENYQKFLVPGESNRLEIITTNANRNLSSPVYSLDYVAPVPAGFGGTVERPTLHALIVGTADYRGTTLDLNFAAKDAEDMATALGIGGKNLFGVERTNIYLMNTDQQDARNQPTKENVAVRMLEIAAKAKPEDVFVLYFSGHGVTYGDPDAQFYYLTKDIESGDISDPEVRRNFTISTNDMVDMINAIPAQKQILILDACASGQAVDDLLSLSKNVSSSQIKALDKMKDRTGLFIIAGSAANKVSYEASQFGQSLLTYSLLNNLNLVSAKSGDGLVDLVDWINQSKEQVPELAGTIGGIQDPVVALPRNLNSFDIARISKEEMVPVASIKPVFVRSTLMNMEEMDDDLGLSDRLDAYFLELSTKGRSPKVVFVDVKEFPAAHSIKGFYSTSGTTAQIQATIRKGDEKIGIISIEGPANDPESLTRLIIAEVEGVMEP